MFKNLTVSTDTKVDHIRVAISGQWTGSELNALADLIGEKVKETGLRRVLLDAINLSVPSTDFERYRLGEYVASTLPGIKISVVYPEKFINKLFENVVLNRGGYVRVVGDEATAMKWLMD